MSRDSADNISSGGAVDISRDGAANVSRGSANVSHGTDNIYLVLVVTIS